MASARANIPKRDRPASAVYIGHSNSQSITSTATPPDIPDLPEPPSPSDTASTSTSGLPSPPATNSTGSGSTGDPASIALRSTPRRPSLGLGLGLASASEGGRLFRAATMSMQGKHTRTLSSGTATSTLSDDIDVDDLDQEDVTARLVPQPPHNDNAAALQRVKSLSERNRAALSKLSSISRLSSPSRRSPAFSGGSGGGGSSNSSSIVAAAYTDPVNKRHSLSGSETERESTTASSHHLTLTRNSTLRHRSGTVTPPPSTRTRLVSAPASPGKALSAVRTSDTARKRVSMVSPSDDADDNHRVTGRESVRSFRRATADSTSPTSHFLSSAQSKRRNPLPREFIEGSSKSPQTPSTPSRRASGALSRASTRQSVDFATSPRSPRISEDGRRQSLRGGSAESALFAVRSLGLTRRDDALGSSKRRERAGTITAPPAHTEFLRDRDTNGRSTSLADYAYRSTSSRSGGGGDGSSSGSGRGRGVREHATGPASLRVLNGHPRDGSPTRDPPRSPHRDRADSSRPPTSLSRYQRHSIQGSSTYDKDREAASSPSPLASSSAKRLTTAGSSSTSSHTQSLSTGSIGSAGGEHTRLLLDALNVFESHLSRHPTPTTNSISKEAQSCVYSAERLNALLRLGTTNALEEQIDVSTAASNSEASRDREAEIWKRVGGEYREAMRVSDELVRSMTGFLLDVGRVFREFAADGFVDAGGRNSRSPPHVNGSGRGSAEYHPSPSFSTREVDRDDALKRLSGATRPGSSLLRDRERQETPARRGTPSRPTPNGSGSVRRYTLRDEGQTQPSPTPPPRIIHTKPSQPSLAQAGVERSKTLPPISIPRPIPTLPSEGASGSSSSGGHKRSATSVTPSMRARAERERLANERKLGGRTRGDSSASATRERSGIYPITTTNTPTTAVTPHTVSSTRPSPYLAARRQIEGDDDVYDVDDYDGLEGRGDGERGLEERGSTERLEFPSISRGNSMDGLPGGGSKGTRDRSGSATSNAAAEQPLTNASTGTGKRRIGGTVTRTSATRALKTSLEGAINSVTGAGGRRAGAHAHAADRSAAASLLSNASATAGSGGATRERRRTVTDIVWS